MTKEEIDEIVERVIGGLSVKVHHLPPPVPVLTDDEKADRDADRNAGWAARAIHAQAALCAVKDYEGRGVERLELARREVAALELIGQMLCHLVDQGSTHCG